MKIICGGQTGVDRAALDVAIAYGIDTGGWCPQGRLAEDGIIPASYPLTELSGAGYRQRTRQNVIDSDGSIIIYFGEPVGGTADTIKFCKAENRPYIEIDGAEQGIEQASIRIRKFIKENPLEVINIAGPRASEATNAYSYTSKVIRQVFSKRDLQLE